MDNTAIKRLIEERATLWEEMKALLDETREAGMSAEQREKYDRLEERVDGLTSEIEARERAAERERELSKARRSAADVDDPAAEKREVSEEEHRSAFLDYMRKGVRDMDVDNRQLLLEHRAQNITTDAKGGFLVPRSMADAIEVARKAFGGVRRSRAFVFTTSDGGVLEIPTADDTGNVGAILTESATISEQDVTFSEVTMDAFVYTSKLVKVTWQLLQDSAFPLETFLADRFGERLGRIENQHFTTGDGVNKPRGWVTAATVGVTASDTNSVTADEVIDLFHSVDPAYRDAAEWQLNDNTLSAVRKLKGSDNNYLWQPGLQSGLPSEILGRPYIVNQDMASIATGNKVIGFGDFSKYYIRQVQSVSIVRLDERYADRLQVGFFAWQRVDGDLIDAGQNPIKVLRMA